MPDAVALPAPDLAAAFDVAPVALAVLGQDGVVVHANAQFAGLLGAAPDTLAGQAADRVFPVELAAAAHAAVASMRAGAACQPTRISLVTATGVIAVEAEWRALYGRNGGPLQAICALHDVTTRGAADDSHVDVADMMAARSAARESEARFGAIFDNAAVGIAQVGADGVLVRINRRLAEILGHPPEALIGRTFADVTHPDDLAVNLAFTEQMRAGVIDEFAMDKRYVRRDGSFVWTTLSVRCIRDASGGVAYFVSVVKDISERKRAQDRVQLLVAEVNHRAKNMLAVVLSIARQTARGEPGAFIDRFSRRIQSLAVAQDLFIASAWGPVSLRDVVTTQLAPFGAVDGARLAVSGPDVDLKPAAAQAVAMAVHELAARASASGALSTPLGRVGIAWAIGRDGRLTLAWRESGASPPASTATPGPDERALKEEAYGAKVILDMARLTMRADVDAGHTPDGFAWTLSAPPDVLAARQADGARAETP